MGTTEIIVAFAVVAFGALATTAGNIYADRVKRARGSKDGDEGTDGTPS